MISPTRSAAPASKTKPWQLYYDAPEIWQAMLESMEDAKVSIDWEQYYFATDGIGRKFIDVLAKKASEGVKVRLLLDSFGSFNPASSVLTPEAMKKIGIEFLFFNWLRPLSKGNHSILYFRNHRRSLIVDKSTGFTGSVCISDEKKEWRETQVKVEGGRAIREMSDAFERMWNRAQKRTWRAGRDIKKGVRPKDDPLEKFSYTVQAPLFNRRYLYYELVRMIRGARRSILITTPYFLPDNRVLRSLLAAVRRGVRVAILIPRETNHLTAQIGMQTYFDEALRGGMEILQYPRMVHAKTAIVDDRWSMVGSLNMDNISLRYNFESAITSRDPSFAKELGERFKKDADGSKALTLSEWKKRPFTYKILECFVWPLRKFL